jgi:hypothetical protein
MVSFENTPAPELRLRTRPPTVPETSRSIEVADPILRCACAGPIQATDSSRRPVAALQ